MRSVPTVSQVYQKCIHLQALSASLVVYGIGTKAADFSATASVSAVSLLTSRELTLAVAQLARLKVSASNPCEFTPDAEAAGDAGPA